MYFVVFSLQAYNTVTSDGARFNEHIAEINARPKTEWTLKPWPPKSKSEVFSHFCKASCDPLAYKT